MSLVKLPLSEACGQSRLQAPAMPLPFYSCRGAPFSAKSSTCWPGWRPTKCIAAPSHPSPVELDVPRRIGAKAIAASLPPHLAILCWRRLRPSHVAVPQLQPGARLRLQRKRRSLRLRNSGWAWRFQSGDNLTEFRHWRAHLSLTLWIASLGAKITIEHTGGRRLLHRETISGLPGWSSDRGMFRSGSRRGKWRSGWKNQAV